MGKVIGSPPKRATTIIDIARDTGFSKSTVSLALRNSPLLPADTKSMIRVAARRMGYRPNMVFSVMGSGNRRKTRMRDMLPLAHLYDLGGSGYSVVSSDIKLLSSNAELYGYFMESFDLSSFKSAGELRRTLYARGVCGVIIDRILDDKSIAYDMDMSMFSVVVHGNTFRSHGYNRVMGDVVAGVQLCWDRMVAAGMRRIGVAPCSHRISLPDDELRLAAILQRQRRDKALVAEIPPFTGEPGMMKPFKTWIEKHVPDAVIGLHTGQFYAVRESARKLKRRIHFASLILYCGDRWSRGIGGISTHTEANTTAAISILDQEIRNRARGMPENIITVQTAPRWIEGRSLPPIRSPMPSSR